MVWRKKCLFPKFTKKSAESLKSVARIFKRWNFLRAEHAVMPKNLGIRRGKRGGKELREQKLFVRSTFNEGTTTSLLPNCIIKDRILKTDLWTSEEEIIFAKIKRWKVREKGSLTQPLQIWREIESNKNHGFEFIPSGVWEESEGFFSDTINFFFIISEQLETSWRGRTFFGFWQRRLSEVSLWL